MKKVIYDVIIVGAGAAGLAACAEISLKYKNARILVIDKQSKIGKKILATGNGRCNLSNVSITKSDYNGSCADMALNIIEKLNSKYLCDFFAGIGLLTLADAYGRIYPYSNSASSVLDILRQNAEINNTEILCDTAVIDFNYKNGIYYINTENEAFQSRFVILACGGKSQQKLGSDGSMLEILKKKDVLINPLFPSLCPLPVKPQTVKQLKGIRALSRVSARINGKEYSFDGEIQFTESAISGICIFQLSRYVNEYIFSGGRGVKIFVDLFPNYDKNAIIDTLYRKKRIVSLLPVEELFTGVINKRLGQAILRQSKIEPKVQILRLTKSEIETIAYNAKHLSFECTELSSFENSQVTCGGVDSSEINPDNLMSLKFKNLYFAGEIIDADGLCGGYNLHWSFVSGITAGKDIAKKLGGKVDKNF